MMETKGYYLSLLKFFTRKPLFTMIKREGDGEPYPEQDSLREKSNIALGLLTVTYNLRTIEIQTFDTLLIKFVSNHVHPV